MRTLQIRNRLAGKLPACVFFALALSLGDGFLAPALRADDPGQTARAIRLSYVDGTVQLSQNSQVIAEKAVINTPLLQGTTITTANDGKAEIQFEDGSVARIAPNSTLTLSTLSGVGTSAEADMTLERGEAYFELQSTGQVGAMRIHFGASTITASGFTVLRVQYDTPPGALAVFSGNAQLANGNSTPIDVRSGESLAFTSEAANGYAVSESIASDSWDAWNSDRDQALNAESAAQTSAPSDLAPGQTSNPAWSDLDANGSWYNVPGQGYVWSPYDAANPGFDPYGQGNWVWIPGFGYTWASGYSWGYLPYSCGAWNFYDGFGWGWAPGFGGCSPWWNLGFYGGPVIGFAPVWYRPIHRPLPPGGPGRGHPVPVIGVVRNEPGTGTPLPARGRNTPVTIGGATVVAMRPMPGRTTLRPGAVVHGFSGTQSGVGTFNINRPGYTAPRSTYSPSSQGVNTPGGAVPNGNPTQRPNGFTPSPQPGRVFVPPTYRGGGSPTTVVPTPSNSTPNQTPRNNYTPPPSSQPSHPSGGGNSGSGFHSNSAPGSNAGGGGSFHGGGGAPSGGGGGHSSGSHK